MDLIFTQSETGKSWVAEFEATADFNLHIERDKGGNLMLYQRTNGGGWDIVNDFANPRFGAIDYDCAALIYPKFVKVVSEVEPTYAAVTSAGEVTEIKSQDKSVEVTSNGTIDVTPDAGFAYLNSVKVKTNVPTSGEGGGGSTGGGSASGDEWVYFDLRNSEYRQDFLFLTQNCPVFLCGLMEYTDMVQYGVTIEAYNNNNSREQLANNLYGMAMYLGGIIKAGGMQFTNEEYINVVTSQMGITNPLDKVPRITKEEFYNLES